MYVLKLAVAGLERDSMVFTSECLRVLLLVCTCHTELMSCLAVMVQARFWVQHKLSPADIGICLVLAWRSEVHGKVDSTALQVIAEYSSALPLHIDPSCKLT